MVSISAVPVAGPVELGESPLWDEARSRLMWVDIPGRAVHEFDPATSTNVTREFQQPVTAVMPHEGGEYLLALGLDLATCAWPDGGLSRLATVDRGERMNDAACDAVGRVLAGTMVGDESGGAALYRYEAGRVQTLLDDVSISNGLDWSPDGRTLYYVDTPLERVDAFDYDVDTGAISARRTLVELHDTPGRPDGLVVDAEGCIWVAMARGGAAIRRYSPVGEAVSVVPLPVPDVTSLAFGGEHLTDVYVTTARQRLDAAERRRWPMAGSLFRITGLGVKGRLPNAGRA